MLVASTRMYNVAPAAAAAWRRLLAAVMARAGVAMQVVDHPHPATLRDLWDRPDLGCAFMCGGPLAREPDARPVLAAPVPADEAGPAYHAVFVVAAGSPYRQVQDCFGARWAFNARDSHSGWTMPRAHLAALGAPAFAQEVGPFGPHQRAAAAVAAGAADLAALDSLVWALLCRHDPALATGLRVIGRTPPQPSPPLVGGRGQPGNDRLRAALLALSQDAEGRGLLADVCLAGFAPAAHADYAITRSLAA